MIHDVDDALRALIEDGALAGEAEISFDAPTRDWASRRSVPTVSVFLYDIREDLTRRDIAPQTVRNEQGQVTLELWRAHLRHMCVHFNKTRHQVAIGPIDDNRIFRYRHAIDIADDCDNAVFDDYGLCLDDTVFRHSYDIDV